MAVADLGRTRIACLFVVAVLSLAAPRVAHAQDYAAILAAADRSDADRQNDKRRDALKLLTLAIAVKACRFRRDFRQLLRRR